MLNRRLIRRSISGALAAATLALPAAAQELQLHRAVYSATMLEHGKPGGGAPGTYAFELKLTCDSYIINQRMRLDVEGGRGSIVSEQQSQMTESRDGKKLHFEHRSTVNGRVASQFRGEASLDDDGRGQARYIEPEGQSVALPAGTMFPIAISRATIRHAKAGDGSFDALFFYGEKVKPPQAVPRQWSQPHLLSRRFLRCPAQGAGRAGGVRDVEPPARQRHRALRHARGGRGRYRIPRHPAGTAAQAELQLTFAFGMLGACQRTAPGAAL